MWVKISRNFIDASLKMVCLEHSEFWEAEFHEASNQSIWTSSLTAVCQRFEIVSVLYYILEQGLTYHVWHIFVILPYMHFCIFLSIVKMNFFLGWKNYQRCIKFFLVLLFHVSHKKLLLNVFNLLTQEINFGISSKQANYVVLRAGIWPCMFLF